MTLKLHNTLTRQKQDFVPLDPANVRMYVCGPTVYDYAHIGNARPVIVFDVLFRLLRHLAAKGEWDGGKGETKVTYVRNITDVDDKINARAARDFPSLALNEAIARVTAATTEQFHKDIAALGVLPPTIEPRATGHIPEMVAMCEALVAKGHAYVAADHVLFDVSSMPDYGKLSNRSLEEMEAGARVEVAPYKKGPMDFVLWKPSKAEEPGWPSPCGIKVNGRPGWHIECSAMSRKHLGEVFDIHGGGIDLAFPHHENEIAQSRCTHGTSVMANYWLHNGFLQVEGEKMSKSLGNFITIHQLLDTTDFGGRRWAGEIVRLSMLMTHYKEPINWSVDRLLEAETMLRNWIGATEEGDQPTVILEPKYLDPETLQVVEPDAGVVEALCDDLNFSAGRVLLDKLSKQAKTGDRASKKTLARTLGWLGLYRWELHGTYLSVDAMHRAHFSYLTKYYDVMREARTVILNEYSLDGDQTVREANRRKIEEKINSLSEELKNDVVELVLSEGGGIELVPTSENAKKGLSESEIQQRIAARLAARAAKDWKEADRIRDELAAQGIVLKDGKDPQTGEVVTTWEVAR